MLQQRVFRLHCRWAISIAIRLFSYFCLLRIVEYVREVQWLRYIVIRLIVHQNDQKPKTNRWRNFENSFTVRLNNDHYAGKISELRCSTIPKGRNFLVDWMNYQSYHVYHISLRLHTAHCLYMFLAKKLLICELAILSILSRFSVPSCHKFDCVVHIILNSIRIGWDFVTYCHACHLCDYVMSF